jgi:CRISPR-associated protein Cas2
MGRCLVVYDIVEDPIRTRISNLCFDYGLSRIQLSAFVGDIARTHQDELLQRIRRVLGASPGHVAVFPLCEMDFRGRREIEVRPRVGVA